MSNNQDRDIFDDAIRRLDRAFEHAEIDEEAVERLKHPKQVLEVSIPVRMDDGSLRVFTAPTKNCWNWMWIYCSRPHWKTRSR